MVHTLTNPSPRHGLALPGLVLSVHRLGAFVPAALLGGAMLLTGCADQVPPAAAGPASRDSGASTPVSTGGPGPTAAARFDELGNPRADAPGYEAAPVPSAGRDRPDPGGAGPRGRGVSGPYVGGFGGAAFP